MKCSTRRSFAHSGRPGMHVGLLVICMILLLNLLGQVVLAQTTPIQHIVFIVKENRGFDHMFGRFPGAEGATQGMISTGQIIPLSRAPDSTPRDFCHTWNCNIAAYDGGRMDKWDVTVGPSDFACNINGDYGCYSQYQQADIPNYWSLASTYTLSDHMFSSIHATSFPNHMFTVAAQSAGIIGQPHLISDSSQGESGCKSDPGSTINVLTSTGNLITPFPCFDFGTITDSLDNASGGPISWSYYSPGNSPYDPLEAINHIRNNAQIWDAHVFTDTQFIPDVQSGKLAAVTWLVSSDQTNEHPPWSICQGENWTLNQITAIMNSSFWDSTAIFVVWDDNGGFYDHYPQPQVDQWGFGPRVPMLAISPYAKPGHIAKTDYEFSSMLKFVEEVFGLSPIAQRDAAANSMIGDIFDWTQQPVPPLILPPRSCSPASSTTLSFPPQQLGTPSAAKIETIYNYGPDNLNIFGINISGSDFTQTNNCPQVIPPPAPGVKSCSINVVFKPTAAGTRTGALTITDSDPGSPRTVSLTGIGTSLALTPNPLTFGQILVSSNKLLNATLKNQGTSPVSITSIVAAGDYSQNNNCPSSLAAGAQCTITVTFAPTVAGTRYGTVTITDSDGSSPQMLNLTGIGTSISIVPASLTFPVTAVGTVSAPKQLTLTNNGNTVLTINQVAIQGTIQQAFFDFMQTNTCGGGVPPGGSCSFNIKFAPVSPGARRNPHHP